MINQENLKKLEVSSQNNFLSLPETGMGYQIIESDKRLVLNAEFILDLKDISNPAEVTWPYAGDNFRQVFFQSPTSQLIVTGFEKIDTEALLSDDSIDKNISVVTNSLYVTNVKPANYPPFTYLTRLGDEFYRLSAYRNDKRVNPDGSLVAGTYGTTTNDLKVVPSGAAAVGRYALPSRIPSTYLFKIIPDPGTPVYFGTVLPNFGLAGGGVEVFFPKGTNSGTVTLIGVLPEF